MQKFRVTTVSRIDGTATTKQFKSYAAARDVFDTLTDGGNRDFYHYAGLFHIGAVAQRCRVMVDGKVVKFIADLAFDTVALNKIREGNQ